MRAGVRSLFLCLPLPDFPGPLLPPQSRGRRHHPFPPGGAGRGRAASAVPSPDPPPGFKPARGARRGQSRAGPLRRPIAQMAALATVAKKVWSARRLLVLLFAPLALLPVVFALPPKVTPPPPGRPPFRPPEGPCCGQDPLFPRLRGGRPPTSRTPLDPRLSTLFPVPGPLEPFPRAPWSPSPHPAF